VHAIMIQGNIPIWNRRRVVRWNKTTSA
jgi:hypothetical protein